MVGDRNQLKAIRPGDVLHQLYEFLDTRGMVADFKHNHRVSESSKLLAQNSELVRRADSGISYDNKNCVFIDKNEYGSISATLNHILEKYKIEEYKHIIITRTNGIRQSLNKVVEEYYHNLDENQRTTLYKGSSYESGRKITFKKNDYDRNIFNNQILYLESIYDEKEVIKLASDKPKQEPSQKKLKIQYETVRNIPDNTSERKEKGFTRFASCNVLLRSGKGKNFEWDKWAQKYVRHASVITTHCFQGSQIHTVVIIIPYFSKYDTQRAFYTAFTRATDRVIIIGSLSDVNKTITNIDPVRDSDLALRLQECCGELVELKPEDCVESNKSNKNWELLEDESSEEYYETSDESKEEPNF